MSEIKSAYEKAMERFQDVKADKKSLKRKQIIDKGRSLCGRFLNAENVDLQAEIDTYSEEERDWFRYGVGEAILSRIILPSTKMNTDFVDPIIKATMIVSAQAAVAEQLLKQYQQLCQQYIDERLKFSEQMEMQMQQMMQQHGAALQNEQQRLAFQQKMVKSMQEQLQQLEDQFAPAVDKVKSNLRQLLGTWIEK